MRIRKRFALVPALLGAALLTGCFDGSTFGTVPQACTFVPLRSITTQATSLKASDMEDLLRKVDAAEAKFSDGKHSDSARKLVEYRDKVNYLRGGSKPKVSAEDAEQLSIAVDATLACVQSFIR